MNEADRVRSCASSLEREVNGVHDRLRSIERELSRVDRRVWNDRRFARPHQDVKNAVREVSRSADRLRDRIRQLERATR